MQTKKPSPVAVPKDSWEGQHPNGSQWALHCGNAAAVLKKFDPEIFNCIITSPPYYWLRDYQVDKQIGLEDTVEEYVSAINNVMEEAYKVLAPDGLLFLNLGDTYYSGKGKSHGTDPKSSKRRFGLRAVDKSGGLDVNAKPKSVLGIPWRVAMRMSENGWVLRSPIIWHRKHCLPESVKDRPRRSYEYVFMFAKNRRYYFNRQPLIEAETEDMWSIVSRPRSANGLGTAPFPDELVERCLHIGCPKTANVLDPFAGSGTTLRVALASGRNVTGIDLNKSFCHHIVETLRKME